MRLLLTSAVSASFTLGKCHCLIDTAETPIATCFKQKHLHLLVEHKSERRVPLPSASTESRAGPATGPPTRTSLSTAANAGPAGTARTPAHYWGNELLLINSTAPHRTKQTAPCRAPGRLELGKQGRSRTWARRWLLPCSCP